MNKLIKIILLLIGILVLACFALVLLPLILIMLMLWMLLGKNRMRVSKWRQNKNDYEYVADPAGTTFTQSDSETEEFRGFSRENNQIIDITAKEVKEKE